MFGDIVHSADPEVEVVITVVMQWDIQAPSQGTLCDRASNYRIVYLEQFPGLTQSISVTRVWILGLGKLFEL